MKSNVLLVALSAAVLAACGAASGSASDPTTLGLTSTNYVTVTQTPTTLTPSTIAGAADAPGTLHPEETTYVIASGDLPSTIARNFKVKFVDLLNINGWTLVGSGNSAQVPEFPGVGTAIKIPPGWTTPGAATDTSGTTATGTTPSTDTTTTIAGGVSTCAAGEYTIVAGDFPAKVAKALDTTVDALNAANAATKGYKSFQVGIKIKTPPKANC
jgi:LysM repeat protein